MSRHDSQFRAFFAMLTLTAVWIPLLAPASTRAATYPILVSHEELTAARASWDVLADVDAADRAAREAQLAGDSAAEEAHLDRILADAFAGIGFPATGIVRVDEPVRLAVRALHVELRRSLGPDFHTVVPGLVEDPGCAGDVIADRLVVGFGDAVNDVGGALGDSHDTLTAFARQVACLGETQLMELDVAMADGFTVASHWLEEAGLGDLVPPFARSVAPLQVLIFDANKHTGWRSEAGAWLDLHHEELVEDVAAAGWATGELLLWDRHTGRLTGFEECGSGSPSRCVDLEAFLASLEDPRALGKGACAFAGMVAKGIEPSAATIATPVRRAAATSGTRVARRPRRWAESSRRSRACGPRPPRRAMRR